MNKFPNNIITKEFLLPPTATAKDGLKIVLLLVMAVLLAFDFFTGYIMGDIRADSANGMFGGLAMMLGPVSPLVIPLLVMCWKPLEFITAAMLFLGVAVMGYQWVRRFKVACPKCETGYMLAHAQTYQFACPNCFHVIDGERNAPQAPLDCAYCGLDYTGSAAKTKACLSCKNDPNEHEQVACPTCSTLIPKGVVFCNSCNTWLETDTDKKSIAQFSHKASISYTLSQIKELNTGIDEQSGVLQDLIERANNCMTGIQMIYARDEKLPLDTLTEFQDILVKITKFNIYAAATGHQNRENDLALSRALETTSVLISITK